MRRTKSRTPQTVAVIAALAVVLAGVAAAAYWLPGPSARRGNSTRLVLTTGAGLPGIARGLERGGVIRSSWLFMAWAELAGAARGLKAGEYDFPSGASMAAVIQEVHDGRVVRHLLTIPEGFSSSQAVQVLKSAGELSGPVSAPAEGSLLPETYQVVYGETRTHVVARMQGARNALVAKLWASRRPGLPYRSPEEAVILASLVEKETAIASERPHVAAIFLNRLARDMRLASDPTVVYGLTGGQPLGHGLRASELARPTPYNTYLVDGLPPTPIANPGRAALAAALNPSLSPDLYFVADGSGGHVFSSTLAEHLKNVTHWRAVEKNRAAIAAGGAK